MMRAFRARTGTKRIKKKGKAKDATADFTAFTLNVIF
jgi:hypothetical protein